LRRLGAAHLHLWGAGSCVDTAKVLISELVTNAVRYGDGIDVGFSIAYGAGQVVIEVADHTPARPRLKQPGDDDESGRGMLLVAAMADAWGTSADGTRTWCSITVPASPPTTDPIGLGSRHETPAPTEAPDQRRKRTMDSPDHGSEPPTQQGQAAYNVAEWLDAADQILDHSPGPEHLTPVPARIPRAPLGTYGLTVNPTEVQVGDTVYLDGAYHPVTDMRAGIRHGERVLLFKAHAPWTMTMPGRVYRRFTTGQVIRHPRT
jgi:hypothetical protein